MKKAIGIIILGLLLVGCETTSLIAKKAIENCADDLWEKNKNLKDGFIEGMDEEEYERNARMAKKPLKEKLQDMHYKDYLTECEKRRNETQITFDEKWK